MVELFFIEKINLGLYKMTSPQTIVDIEKHVLEQKVEEMSDEALMTRMRGFFDVHNKGKITVIRRTSSRNDDGHVLPDDRVSTLQTIAHHPPDQDSFPHQQIDPTGRG